ncbi:MAG: RNA methyltransferase [Clostridia bacterium]|nr:RNA methyltransferase [Clostridia bacterium]
MITSRQNPWVKRVRSLKDKKNRDALAAYVAEGAKSVAEALKCGAKPLFIGATKDGAALVQNTVAKYAAGVLSEILSDDVFKSISEDVSPQGVIAVLEKPSLTLKKPNGTCLYLDGVSDPANVGAIIRTAAACGIKDIYAAEGSADAYSPKAVRASMGGIFRVNVYSGGRKELLDAIDLPLIVADMDGENVFNSKIAGDFCLCVGNEAHGVSDYAMSRAARIVAIPMKNGMESLNAAVSAGIIIYALTINK